MLLSQASWFTGAAAAGGGSVTEVSSTPFEQTTVVANTDNTVTIAAGSNRVLLDFTQTTNPGTHSCTLDPAGANIALTALTGSPAWNVQSQENLVGFRLLEAAFPGTTGSKTLRLTTTNTTRGHRRVVMLSGAAQTIYSAGNNTATTVLTISVTRPSGTFPVGSRVYAAINCNGTTAFTVTGDATEVQDVASTASDEFVFAAGVLASAVATASVTFTRGAGGTIRNGGVIVVVEPA